jgi:hypothetical protein
LLSATLIGWALKGRSYTSILVGSVAAPTVFFLLSNFNVWLAGTEGGYYSKDFTGLMASYTAGLPFYKNALIATIVFLPAILFSYNLITKQRTSLTLA